MKIKSICCGAPVRVTGKLTHYYECIKCKKPCDVEGVLEKGKE